MARRAPYTVVTGFGASQSTGVSCIPEVGRAEAQPSMKLTKQKSTMDAPKKLHESMDESRPADEPNVSLNTFWIR